MTRPLWRHQRHALERIEENEASMVHYGMGTGKSRVIVEYCRRHKPERTLIISPLSVTAVWPYQFAQHGPDAVPGGVCVLNQQSVARKRVALDDYLRLQHARRRPAVAVVNYESVWRGELADLILEHQWDLVVLDESHRAKSITSRVTRWLSKKLRRKALKRVCLTGTMMPHSPLDVLGQFAFLDPSLLGVSKTAFLRRYAVLGGFENREVKRWVNMEELEGKLAYLTVQARTGEVLDLPETVDRVVPVELEASAQKIYTGLDEDFVASIEGGEITVANALAKLLRLQQITGGWCPDETGELRRVSFAKAAALADIISDAPGPLVVFCRFRSDLDTVYQACADKAKCLELSGRRNELAAWQKGEADVLAVQIQAGGVGVDLTRACQCVYYSVGFSLGDYLQSRARVHRPGQDRPVTYHHLVARNTIDQQVYSALEKKQDVVEAILREVGGFVHERD